MKRLDIKERQHVSSHCKAVVIALPQKAIMIIIKHAFMECDLMLFLPTTVASIISGNVSR